MLTHEVSFLNCIYALRWCAESRHDRVVPRRSNACRGYARLAPCRRNGSTSKDAGPLVPPTPFSSARICRKRGFRSAPPALAIDREAHRGCSGCRAGGHLALPLSGGWHPSARSADGKASSAAATQVPSPFPFRSDLRTSVLLHEIARLRVNSVTPTMCMRTARSGKEVCFRPARGAP